MKRTPLRRTPFNHKPPHKRLKASKKRMRAWHDKPKAGTRPRVIRELDILVSQRTRQETPYCVLCGERDPQKLTCGHYIKRGNQHVRWTWRNLHTLCKICNGRDNEDRKPYTRFMLRTYTPKEMAELYGLASQTRKISTVELEELLITLKGVQS
jgi:5-methylcytosine-specific restriction endonuclease McrA